MNDSQRNGVTSADLFGPIVFMGASIIGVAVSIALWRGMPQEGAAGIGAIARAVILAVGHAPALLFAAGAAFLGARVFLRGDFDDFVRDFSGVAGTTAGLAILLGALSESGGGGLGAATGGAVSRYLTRIVGGLIGLAAFATPIWMTWARESGLLAAKRWKESHLTASISPGKKAPKQELPTQEVDAREAGVSQAEAQALLPDSSKIEAAQASSTSKLSVEQLLAGGVPDWALKNESHNPYPADPRLAGQIPTGAKPLKDPDVAEARTAERDEPAEVSNVQRWTPNRGADSDDTADDDLAGVPVREPKSLAKGVGRSPKPVKPAEPLATAGSKSASERVDALLGERGRGDSSDEDRKVEVLKVDGGAPRPSWETAAETKDVEEEPVKASSTVWHPTGQAPAAPVAVDVEDDEDLEIQASSDSDEDEWEYEDVDESEDLDGAASDDEEEDEEDDDEYEFIEVSEGEEGYEDAEELEEEEDEDGEFAASATVDGDDDDEEEEDEDDDEYEYVEVAEGEEGYEDAEEFEEDEVLASDSEVEDEEEAEDAEDEDALELAETEESAEEIEEPLLAASEELDSPEENEEETVLEEQPGLDATEAEPELVLTTASQASLESEESSEAAAGAIDDPDNGEIQMDLFADPVEGTAKPAKPSKPSKAEKSVKADKGKKAPQASKTEKASRSAKEGKASKANQVAELDVEEPVVVLQPKAPPALTASENAQRAADLILAESRVAVSLLQKSFGMDFKQSCAILDELQDLGFIGPYIDGKQRDILMDREEWLSAVGAE